MKNVTIKKVKLFGVFCLLFGMLLFTAGGVRADAASAKTKAVRAYTSLLKKSKVTLKGGELHPVKARFAVAYIDNDSVPELIIEDMEIGCWYLLTYRNNKVKCLECFIGVFSMNYYKKKGILTMDVEGFGGESLIYSRISNGKITDVASQTQSVGSGKNIYYVKSKKTSKAVFNKYLKNLTGSKKAVKIKFYKNTAANRKKYIK